MLPWTAWVRWCPPVLLLSWSWFSHSLCADVLSLSCPYICLSGFLCTHLLFLVLAMMSILLGFVLNRMPSRNPRKQHTVVCCIHGTSRPARPKRTDFMGEKHSYSLVSSKSARSRNCNLANSARSRHYYLAKSTWSRHYHLTSDHKMNERSPDMYC